VSPVTLQSLVKNVIDIFQQLGDSSSVPRTRVADEEELPYVLRAWKQMDSFPMQLLELGHWLDDVLGRDVLMFVKERALRGTEFSSVWARPWKIAWAQPSKSPFWPGMILAGHNVPEEISLTNVN